MKRFKLLFLLMISSQLIIAQESIHEFSFKMIDGSEKSFGDFEGKKILLFNAASACGYTPQYKDLEKLHDTYKDKLVVIGFPANNFGGQEPGSNEEIATFCEKNYGVTFTMAEKVSVVGNDINPLFRWLTTQENNSYSGDIKWNFEKFLIDEKGKLTHRFRSNISPMGKEITKLI